MSNTYIDLQNSHPCFGGHKNNAGRIHLPVSPGCNIACRFCDRTINDVEERPGVTSKVLKPEECEEILKKALEICPDIKVAGIAGPGDTLASDYALETFEIVKEKFPELIKCMSTNGLLLNERADDVIRVGIDSLTVTVNAIASSDGIVVNSHFGRAGKFYIYEVSDENVSFIELREVEPVCNGGNHEEDKLERNMQILSDCQYLLVSKIGNGAAMVAESFGIEPYEIPGMITESIEQLIKFIKIKSLFQ